MEDNGNVFRIVEVKKEANPSTINQLEFLLAKAKDGDLNGVVAIYRMGANDYGYVYSGFDEGEIPGFVGMFEVVKKALLNKMFKVFNHL